MRRKFKTPQETSKGPASERNTSQANQKLNLRGADVGREMQLASQRE
jgi:hypothetical protein